MVDESDDYFELRDTKGDWSQRTYLRDCVPNEKGIRHIKFSGWPAEVKNVDLVRGYLATAVINVTIKPLFLAIKN